MPLVAVIVDAPLVSEVSSPETDTLATEPSDEVHVTDAPVIGWPAASSTVTPTVAVSPSDTNSSVSALSTTEAAAWLTMIGATDCADPLLAVTSAEPSLTAVTRPAESTVATEGSLDVHVTEAPTNVAPCASSTVASTRVVSVSELKVIDPSLRVMLPATCVTSTSAVALAVPLVAVIVAEPLVTDVTSPSASTVATATSELAHVTLAPEITASFASDTVAVSRSVSPKEANATVSASKATVDVT